jgi:MSHA biogenesis protein MshL
MVATGLVMLLLTLGCAGSPQAKTKTTQAPAPAPAKEVPLEELTVPQIQEKPPPQLVASGPAKLYTLRIRDGQLRDVLLALAQESGENLVVDPEVTGQVTIDLNRVTLDQALAAIVKPLGYTYRQEGRLIHISKPIMETRLFSLNYLNTRRRAEKKITATHGTSVSGAKISGSESSITGTDELDPWVEIQEGLTALVFGKEKPEEVIKAREKGVVSSLTSPDGRKLVISRATGVVLVHDYPEKFREVAEFLERVEGSAQRQVLIQAQILEVTLNKDYTTGIRWDNIQNQLLNLNISTLNFSWNIAGETTRSGILGVTGAAASSSSNPFVLSDLIQALEVQGKVNTLASPRVATLNNQVAIIKIADQDVFFTTQTTDATLTTGRIVEYTPNVVDIGVILDVTPQIAADGSIIMNIHPSFSEKIKDVPSPDNITTFPLLSIRETDTVVRVRDGQNIIIAGLIKNSRNDTRTGVPCLMDIPLLGHLFRYTEDISNKSELVILLTPTVLVGKKIDEVSSEDLGRLEDFKNKGYQR